MKRFLILEDDLKKNFLFKKVNNEHNPSRWNKFRNTYSDYKLFVKFNVTINTNKLSVFRIRNERLRRLNLIHSLHRNGLSNKQISEYLNKNKLKTFRTNNSYSPKLVWITIKRYKNRLLRNIDKIIQIKEGLYVTTKNINKR